YLTTYYLMKDASLRGDFVAEVQDLVTRLAGALGVPVTQVEVDIANQELKLPGLPKLELCGSSSASVNGFPFARVADGYSVPIAFKPPPSKRAQERTGATPAPAQKPEGIASVYGPAKAAKTH